MLQIPAFLCRQTDMLLAAGKQALRSTSKRASFWPLGKWRISSPSRSTVATNASADRTRHIFWVQHACRRHARAAADGTNGLSGGDGCDPLCAATRWRGGSSGGQREFAPVMARAAAADRRRVQSSWKRMRTPTMPLRRPEHDLSWTKCQRFLKIIDVAGQRCKVQSL